MIVIVIVALSSANLSTTILYMYLLDSFIDIIIQYDLQFLCQLLDALVINLAAEHDIIQAIYGGNSL